MHTMQITLDACEKQQTLIFPMKRNRMIPTEELRAEHAGIIVVLDILESMSEKIVSGELVPIEHLRQVFEFLEVFVNECHHSKEEKILFPALENAGVPRPGAIEAMLSEHEKGRKLMEEIRSLMRLYESGDKGSLLILTNPAQQYSNLLRSHIWKENSVLFPLAEQKIPVEKMESILRDFEKFEEERIGQGRHETFHAVIGELSQIYLPNFQG